MEEDPLEFFHHYKRNKRLQGKELKMKDFFPISFLYESNCFSVYYTTNFHSVSFNNTRIPQIRKPSDPDVVVLDVNS